MTSTTIEAAGASRGPAGEPVRRVLWERLYCDRRGNVSRPKLLLTIAAADVVLVGLAGVLALHLTSAGLGLVASLAVGLTGGFAVAGVLKARWAYTVPALRQPWGQARKVMLAVLIVFLAAAGLAYLLHSTMLPPAAILSWAGLTVAALLVLRVAIASAVTRLSAAGRLVRRTVIVGGGPEAEALMTAFAKDRNLHLQILGVFDDRQGERSSMSSSAPRLSGTFEDLAQFCHREDVDLAIVTVPARAEERLLQVLQKLFGLPVDVRVSALTARLRFNSSVYSYIGAVPMLAIMDKPLSDWDRVLKNIEDRVLGALLLLAAAPVMALVALAVRLDSKGPILFKQRRYGFNNELIEVYKFRSMYVEQSDATAAKLVTKGDPRVTRVGRIIRKTSLDELPQLLNVVRGQMSLVGPRPHATSAKAGGSLYEDVVNGYFARHRVKPGVTGWAQINGWRGETDTEEKIQRRVELDLAYIDRWSVLFDLYIILATPFALISAKNAY